MVMVQKTALEEEGRCVNSNYSYPLQTPLQAAHLAPLPFPITQSYDFSGSPAKPIAIK